MRSATGQADIKVRARTVRFVPRPNICLSGREQARVEQGTRVLVIFLGWGAQRFASPTTGVELA